MELAIFFVLWSMSMEEEERKEAEAQETTKVHASLQLTLYILS
jgi:hypothetical protein